jgi:hypothetical protein
MSKIIDISDDELPLTHVFSDGVYAREIFMPAGMIVVGHVHNTTHLNIVSTGKAIVWMNDTVVEITAPYTFESKAGTRKVLYILEDMFWTTIHATDSRDIDELENTLVDRKASEELMFDLPLIKSQFLEYKGE